MTTSGSACPFCSLDDPAMTVYSDPLIQAVVSKRPVNQYHVIVVPRTHAEQLIELPPQTAAAAIHAAQRIARAIVKVAHPDGITYITEDDLTGQGCNLVAHWKLHVIARYRDDAVRLEWHRADDPGEVVRAEIASALRPYVVSATQRPLVAQVWPAASILSACCSSWRARPPTRSFAHRDS